MYEGVSTGLVFGNQPATFLLSIGDVLMSTCRVVGAVEGLMINIPKP